MVERSFYLVNSFGMAADGVGARRQYRRQYSRAH
jgi:hypothetical protein